MSCNFCPNTEWFELISSCGIRFRKTSKAFKTSELSLDEARKYAEYRLPPEEIYLYRDDKIAIFRDIAPNTRFHILVMPIMHIEQPAELVKYPEIFHHMFKVALDLITHFEDMRETTIYINQRSSKLVKEFTKHVHLQLTSTTTISNQDIRDFFKTYSI